MKTIRPVIAAMMITSVIEANAENRSGEMCVTCDAAAEVDYNGNKTVVTWTQNGSFTVYGSGTMEILAVGGGGGGGSGDNTYGGAGGGAGGLVHLEDVHVGPGTYVVTIGAGGAVGANGGNTSVSELDIVAYGGGAGSAGQSPWGGSDGASGGGGATANGSGGKAVYTDKGNQGNAGGASVHIYGPGGGGGAGQPGEGSGGSAPGKGGDGLMCSITGKDVYYAGGGAGYRYSFYIGENVKGGLGGGGDGGVRVRQVLAAVAVAAQPVAVVS